MYNLCVMENRKEERQTVTELIKKALAACLKVAPLANDESPTSASPAKADLLSASLTYWRLPYWITSAARMLSILF